MKTTNTSILIISTGFVSCKQKDKSAKKETGSEISQDAVQDKAKDFNGNKEYHYGIL
jgi:hypothetical protein